MTEQEARRILDEHRAERPVFIRGKHRYAVNRDGDVDVYNIRGKTCVYSSTVERDSYALHVDVRRMLA